MYDLSLLLSIVSWHNNKLAVLLVQVLRSSRTECPSSGYMSRRRRSNWLVVWPSAVGEGSLKRRLGSFSVTNTLKAPVREYQISPPSLRITELFSPSEEDISFEYRVAPLLNRYEEEATRHVPPGVPIHRPHRYHRAWCFCG